MGATWRGWGSSETRGTRPAPGPSGGSVLTAVSVRAPHSSVLSNQSKPTASLVTHPMTSLCNVSVIQFMSRVQCRGSF